MKVLKKIIALSFCVALLYSCAIGGNLERGSVKSSDLSRELEVSGQISRNSRAPRFIGMITASYVPSQFSTYWNQVTPENGGKWGSVEKSRDKYSWKDQDTAYKYAKSKGYPFKAHCLVWGSQQPSWIQNLSKKNRPKRLKSGSGTLASVILSASSLM